MNHGDQNQVGGENNTRITNLDLNLTPTQENDSTGITCSSPHEEQTLPLKRTSTSLLEAESSRSRLHVDPSIVNENETLPNHHEQSGSFVVNLPTNIAHAPPRRRARTINAYRLGPPGRAFLQTLSQPPRVPRNLRDMENSRQRRRIIIQQGLTEDVIMSNIGRGNFIVNSEVTHENKELCTICQAEFLNGEEIGRLDCGHRFHINCIKEWLGKKNECPLCKRRGLYVAG